MIYNGRLETNVIAATFHTKLIEKMNERSFYLLLFIKIMIIIIIIIMNIIF